MNLDRTLWSSVRPMILIGIYASVLSCGSPTTSEVRIVNLPDSVLMHFSYSLFPEGGFHGYIKQTSMYNSALPILQHAGSFTSRGSHEALVVVPYVSVHGSFSKIFIVKNVYVKPELVSWFQNDCTTYSIIDVDNDGVDEIVTEYTYRDPENALHKTYQIFSLAQDQTRVIYQSHSQDSREAYNMNDRIAGDTILTWLEDSLVDTNHDRVFEVMKITRLVRVIGDQSSKSNSSETRDTVMSPLVSAIH
jgi:hypothetical protein